MALNLLVKHVDMTCRRTFSGMFPFLLSKPSDLVASKRRGTSISIGSLRTQCEAWLEPQGQKICMVYAWYQREFGFSCFIVLCLGLLASKTERVFESCQLP